MSGAKDLIVRPIDSATARELVCRVHYSGKFVNNSQLHFGVYWNGKLEGAMQFGPPLDRRKILTLVEGTRWDGVLELNRMAFGEALPRNSESRALAVAFRLIKRYAPQVDWIVSFADAAQCGDGTIYRAAGFWLTQIKRNTSVWRAPTGEDFARVALSSNNGSTKQIKRAQALAMTTTDKGGAVFSRTSLTDPKSRRQKQAAQAVVSRTKPASDAHAMTTGGASMKVYMEAGFRPIEGFQIRYIYPLKPDVRERLTVPILPFSELDEVGARMYRGQRVGGAAGSAPDFQSGGGGSIPTPTLEP